MLPTITIMQNFYQYQMPEWIPTFSLGQLQHSDIAHCWSPKIINVNIKHLHNHIFTVHSIHGPLFLPLRLKDEVLPLYLVQCWDQRTKPTHFQLLTRSQSIWFAREENLTCCPQDQTSTLNQDQGNHVNLRNKDKHKISMDHLYTNLTSKLLLRVPVCSLKPYLNAIIKTNL